MDSEKIKEIWKNNVVNQIDNYTDAEIEAMILKNARKAIGLSYLGITSILLSVILTFFSVWLGLKYTPQMRIFWMVFLGIQFVGICITIFSRRKMQRYSYDMPLKDWIESRIREFDKSIKLKKVYWFALTYGVSLLFLTVFGIFLILTANIPVSTITITITVALITMIIFSEIGKRVTMKRMIEARKQLQELYDQL